MTNSVKTTARIGGVLYLVIIVAGLFGETFVRNKLMVPGDATATANNIMASPMLWRAGIAGDLIMHVCDIYHSGRQQAESFNAIVPVRWRHLPKHV